MKKIKLKKNKKEKSNKWLSRHLNDIYYQEAKKKGYRSRSAFKLLQINKKFNLFFKGANVLDLGAAPGGWCQVAKELIGSSGSVFGVDRLEINKINGIDFFQGDINDEKIRFKITNLEVGKFDVVLSDMAPNTTGHNSTDHIRIVNLVEIAIDIADQFLKKNGFFVCKVFQGGAQGKLLEFMKLNIKDIKYFKPDASRKESPETYLIGKKK